MWQVRPPSRSSHTLFLPLPLLPQKYLEAPRTTPRPETPSRVISRVLSDQAFEALVSPVILLSLALIRSRRYPMGVIHNRR